MPIVEKLMNNLTARYGPEKGRNVYYAMEAEGKGPFAPGAKHRALHEDFAARNKVTPVGKNKPAGPKARRASKGR